MEDCDMRKMMSRGFTPRWRTAALAGLTLLLGALAASPASAWWSGGVWIGVPPVVVGPGYYYPPPYYYPPYWPGYYYPPGYAAPPASHASATAPRGPVAYGSMCYAGIYNCAAAARSPVGSVCSCPGIGAPSYGTVN
jgi:hypothetical protein